MDFWNKTLKVDSESLNKSENVSMGKKFVKLYQDSKALDLQRQKALADIDIREANLNADIWESILTRKK